MGNEYSTIVNNDRSKLLSDNCKEIKCKPCSSLLSPSVNDFHYVSVYTFLHNVISLDRHDKKFTLSRYIILMPRSHKWSHNVKIYIDTIPNPFTMYSQTELNNETLKIIKKIRTIVADKYDSPTLVKFTEYITHIFSKYYILPVVTNITNMLMILFDDNPSSVKTISLCNLNRPCFKIPLNDDVVVDDLRDRLTHKAIDYNKTDIIKKIEDIEPKLKKVENKPLWYSPQYQYSAQQYQYNYVPRLVATQATTPTPQTTTPEPVIPRLVGTTQATTPTPQTTMPEPVIVVENKTTLETYKKIIEDKYSDKESFYFKLDLYTYTQYILYKNDIISNIDVYTAKINEYYKTVVEPIKKGIVELKKLWLETQDVKQLKKILNILILFIDTRVLLIDSEKKHFYNEITFLINMSPKKNKKEHISESETRRLEVAQLLETIETESNSLSELKTDIVNYIEQLPEHYEKNYIHVNPEQLFIQGGFILNPDDIIIVGNKWKLFWNNGLLNSSTVGSDDIEDHSNDIIIDNNIGDLINDNNIEVALEYNLKSELVFKNTDTGDIIKILASVEHGSYLKLTLNGNIEIFNHNNLWSSSTRFSFDLISNYEFTYYKFTNFMVLFKELNKIFIQRNNSIITVSLHEDNTLKFSKYYDNNSEENIASVDFSEGSFLFNIDTLFFDGYNLHTRLNGIYGANITTVTQNENNIKTELYVLYDNIVMLDENSSVVWKAFDRNKLLDVDGNIITDDESIFALEINKEGYVVDILNSPITVNNIYKLTIENSNNSLFIENNRLIDNNRNHISDQKNGINIFIKNDKLILGNRIVNIDGKELLFNNNVIFINKSNNLVSLDNVNVLLDENSVGNLSLEGDVDTVVSLVESNVLVDANGNKLVDYVNGHNVILSNEGHLLVSSVDITLGETDLA